MIESVTDSHVQLGHQIRMRRIAMQLTQVDAAAKAGVAYRTWRRMEKDGSAAIEDLDRAAVVLRCEQGLKELFPESGASSMDELLARQKLAAQVGRKRVRA
jgi:transcriptional regulator with XRE-family HTH domain